MAWFPCQQWLQSHRRGWSALDVLCPACGICAKRGCTVSRAVNVSLVGVPVDCLVARVDRSRKLPWACRGPGCSCLRCGVVEDLQGPCSFVVVRERKRGLFASVRGLCGLGHLVSWSHDSYLVDPASSHMLVSKTKPCMSKYKRFYTVKLRMAH